MKLDPTLTLLGGAIVITGIMLYAGVQRANASQGGGESSGGSDPKPDDAPDGLGTLPGGETQPGGFSVSQISLENIWLPYIPTAELVITEEPTPGRWYSVRDGDVNLNKIAERAYGANLADGGETWINRFNPFAWKAFEKVDLGKKFQALVADRIDVAKSGDARPVIFIPDISVPDNLVGHPGPLPPQLYRK